MDGRDICRINKTANFAGLYCDVAVFFLFLAVLQYLRSVIFQWTLLPDIHFVVCDKSVSFTNMLPCNFNLCGPKNTRSHIHRCEVYREKFKTSN